MPPSVMTASQQHMFGGRSGAIAPRKLHLVAAPTTGPTTAAHTDELRALSDRALASAAAIGDRAAFEEIVRRFGPDMLRYSCYLLPDRGAAEEIVQDALVAAWTGLGRYRAESTLRTWLFSIVTNKVTDHRRRRSIPAAEAWVFDRPSTDPRHNPHTAISNSDFLIALDTALGELPYRQRACWLLREVEGLKLTEIGTVMSLSPNAVRGHLARARTTLGRTLQDWER